MEDFKEFVSPIKLNLFLEVINKSKDGYHNLESLMTFCKFGDQIKIKKSTKFKFSIDGPFSKNLSTKSNIILNTIVLLEKYLNLKFNVEIILTKNLPISSGMGGGSSNAATIIHCLKNLYNFKIRKKELDFLLFTLGADVPFCYYRKSAIVRGKGEKISFIKKKLFELPVVLINPLIEISTKQIFENLFLNSKKKEKFENEDINSEDLFLYLAKRRNDLQNSAEKICPKIKEVNNFLNLNTKATFARMTGSGATCFGIYTNMDDAISAENLLKKKYKKMWIKRTQIINNV